MRTRFNYYPRNIIKKYLLPLHHKFRTPLALICKDILNDCPIFIVIPMADHLYIPQSDHGANSVYVHPNVLDNHNIARQAITSITVSLGNKNAAAITKGAISINALSKTYSQNDID